MADRKFFTKAKGKRKPRVEVLDGRSSYEKELERRKRKREEKHKMLMQDPSIREQLIAIKYSPVISEMMMIDMEIKRLLDKINSDPVERALFTRRVLEECVYNDPDYINMHKKLAEKGDDK